MTEKENFKVFAKNTLTIGIVFGLITGLVEGLLLFGLFRAGLLTWRLQNRAIWYETLWIAPLVDLVLFTLVGGLFVLVGRILLRIQIKKVAWFTFILLAIFDWMFIILFGKVSLIAIAILVAGICLQIFNFVVKHEVSALAKLHKALPWLAGLTAVIFITIKILIDDKNRVGEQSGNCLEQLFSGYRALLIDW